MGGTTAAGRPNGLDTSGPSATGAHANERNDVIVPPGGTGRGTTADN
jgi:hypothetical protein